MTDYRNCKLQKNSRVYEKHNNFGNSFTDLRNLTSSISNERLNTPKNSLCQSLLFDGVVPFLNIASTCIVITSFSPLRTDLTKNLYEGIRKEIPKLKTTINSK